MELIKPGKTFNFMRFRGLLGTLSFLLVLGSLASLFWPGPNFGIDFQGGTELQLRFRGNVSAGKVRQTLEKLGYERPEVVNVEGSSREFMIRVQQVSSLSKSELQKIRQGLTTRLGAQLKNVSVSPGGDKITLRMAGEADPGELHIALRDAGAKVRLVEAAGKRSEHRYEAQLLGVADEMVRGLRQALGSAGPEDPRRVEWVGPKAGEQLRSAALKALLYAVGFIMVYVAFRFDLRFAPGGVLALFHDVVITLGVYVLLRKQVNLTTIAALLTVLGYSINDTIVVYDRIRENMGRFRDKSLFDLINLSTSQMLARTLITSGTTLLSIGAFFIWGTEVIQDIAFALLIGIGIGTYSSIYIAAPMTEWMDRRFFRGV